MIAAALTFLQGKIILIIFGEIHGFCLGRDPFAWIILEFAAFVILIADALFHTKHLTVFQHCAESAVCAGFFDFFPEQHWQTSMIFAYYTPSGARFLLFFRNFKAIRRKYVKIRGHNIQGIHKAAERKNPNNA